MNESPIALPAIISTLTAAFVGVLSWAFAYFKWLREIKIKLAEIRETVSVELIRLRVELE